MRTWLAAALLCHVAAEQVQVHIVCHTHDDVGWLKTVDEYYTGQNNSIQHAYVHMILDTVVRALAADKSRTFTYVEQAFFVRWWRQQDERTKALVKDLVKDGRLEFTNGGWCMHDEAAPHYVDMIDQTTLGHKFLMDEFGVAPRTGWQLDPFGHSATQASLLSAEVGFQGLFFGRIDYQDLELRQQQRSAEFVWRASKSLGATSQVFTGLTGEYQGNYGPPGGFDWDVRNSDETIQDDPALEDYNVKSRVEDFVQAALTEANMTRGKNIMMTMGSDFQYEDAASWYFNLDRLIQHVNADGRVKVFYSTPSRYVDAKRLETKVMWPLKEDDFFPYADGPHKFWTGYFTSRPALKRYIRDSSAFFQVSKQVGALAQLTGNAKLGPGVEKLAEAMGVAQHHDAVSGTAKQHVTFDYAKRLSRGRNSAMTEVAGVLQSMMEVKAQQDFTVCELRNISSCAATESVGRSSKRTCFALWNGLAREREALHPRVSWRTRELEGNDPLEPLKMEPPSNYPKKFYCGAGRRLRKTGQQDWRPAKPGDASRKTAYVLAVGDWGATTCPHETWDEHMTKCVKYIVMERQRGAAWKDIYQSPGYLRCGSLHHLCMYDPALWGLAQCDPNNAAWWKDSFAQYAVADGMAAASSSVNTVDFVISVGDNFYLRGVMDEFDLNWRYMFEEVYHHESLQVPWLNVLGNHDYGGHECDGCLFEGGTGGCSDAQISYDDEKSWEFPAPKRKRWVLPKRYYKKSFKYQDFSIDVFAIDSNWVNSHSLCHGQSKITSEKVCNAAQCETFHQKTYAAQLQWLREELPKSNATWKWVVGHHPCEMLGDVMLKLFASNGVSLIFAGHVHQLRLDRVKDVYCVITGAGGGYQWNGGSHLTNTIRDSGGREYGFAMVEVNKSKTILRFLNSDRKVLWDETLLENPNAQEVEVEPIPAKDAEILADYEAEEDKELDTGLPCQWADWEDGECDATCGDAVMVRRRQEVTKQVECKDEQMRVNCTLEPCTEPGTGTDSPGSTSKAAETDASETTPAAPTAETSNAPADGDETKESVSLWSLLKLGAMVLVLLLLVIALMILRRRAHTRAEGRRRPSRRDIELT